jgi:hypothetical protein
MSTIKKINYIIIELLALSIHIEFGYYKSYPLKNNLVLEISKKRDTEGLLCNSAFSL